MSPRAYRSVRRTAAAAATREAILGSALTLFESVGYAATSVPAVAAHASVSVPTVYASVGTKPQLLLGLLEDAASDDAIADTMRQINNAPGPDSAVRLLAHGTRQVAERHSWLLSALYDNAAADPLIGERLRLANGNLEANFASVAQRLHRLGAAVGRPQTDVTAVLLFYFGFRGWRSLRECGWSWDAAEAWLTRQATRELL